MKKLTVSICSIILFICIWGSGCAQIEVTNLEFKSIQTSEPDSLKTLKSLHIRDNLYMMTYYGDYKDRLNETNERILKRGLQSVRSTGASIIECSMFAALGDVPLYGRNFDNPECGVLVTLYHPPDGYASIGFSRMNDFEFNTEEDPTRLPISDRRLLLNAPFFTPDGMNECGVAVALAALRSVNIHVDQNKKTIFITCLVREILDHAKNIDEAVAIIQNHNVFDSGTDAVSHHLLISDPSGRSVIVEYFEGEWRTMPNERPWQVITNSPLYQKSEKSRRNVCWRYKILSETFAKDKENITWEQGFHILESVSVKGTQWSTIYDMKKREIYISLYRDFKKIKKVNMEK